MNLNFSAAKQRDYSDSQAGLKGRRREWDGNGQARRQLNKYNWTAMGLDARMDADVVVVVVVGANLKHLRAGFTRPVKFTTAHLCMKLTWLLFWPALCTL